MAIKVTVVSPSKNRISINRTNNVGGPSTSQLSNLVDVDASDADNNEVLVYDENQRKYVVKALPIVNGGTF